MTTFDSIESILNKLHIISMQRTDPFDLSSNRNMTVHFLEDRVDVNTCKKSLSNGLNGTKTIYNELNEISDSPTETAARFVLSRLFNGDYMRGWQFREIYRPHYEDVYHTANDCGIKCIFNIYPNKSFGLRHVLLCLSDDGFKVNPKAELFIQDIINNINKLPPLWRDSINQYIDLFCKSLPVKLNKDEREYAYSFLLKPDILFYLFLVRFEDERTPIKDKDLQVKLLSWIENKKLKSSVVNQPIQRLSSTL